MLLSIITVNLNNVHGLQKTMESVIIQTCGSYEWIVIDGGSSDGSKELLEANKELFTHLVSEPDSGVYEAMNKGILLAKGEYLSFMNSGDCFADESVLEYFLTHCDGSDYVVGQSVHEGDYLPSKSKSNKYTPEDELFQLCFSAYQHQSMFIRRAVFEKYGLYREDKMIASDWYSSINAIIKGGATVSHLPFVVSVCEKDGISSRMRQKLGTERNDLIKENPYFAALFEFYLRNLEIVTALKSNRFAFFLFRIYFFFYRKLRPRNS